MAASKKNTTVSGLVPATKAREGRLHYACYASDKRNGGWNVRVSGPAANTFAGKSVPVEQKNGSENVEELDRLLWSGPDQETGELVGLYSFKPKPRDKEDEIPF